MDGWESRRRRLPGHDWCVIKLGLPGIIRGVEIDTAFFTGNQVNCLAPNLNACKLILNFFGIVVARVTGPTLDLFFYYGPCHESLLPGGGGALPIFFLGGGGGGSIRFLSWSP